MISWRPTAGLIRATVLATLGVGGGVLLGSPALVVMTAPFALLAALGLLHRPTASPRAFASVEHTSLHEGQGTTSRLRLEDADGLEHVVRCTGRAPYVATHPVNGTIGALVTPEGELPQVEISPRRWGRRRLGDEKIGLTAAWAGFRCGPTHLGGGDVVALPTSAPFDSRAEAPQPMGLVGANRSRRFGDGSEFAEIRGFHAGDRLRRINWRVSLRTGDLHVETAQAEEDSGVLILVDGLADHGRSGGVDGRASSLDVTVRAAAALAEHFTHTGDRVAVRVVGGSGEFVGYGAGKHHLHRLLTTLARIQPNEPRDLVSARMQFRATPGTVVLMLSPMLHEAIVTATAMLVRRGLPVLVIDTLPDDVTPATVSGADPRTAALAWRMRLTDRDGLLDQLARTGCPVVPWHGPGTLDAVLRRLARRAQLPQAVNR
ncbi:MAG TPA: DUF58 domain-containing protein [Nocardioides sp.]